MIDARQKAIKAIEQYKVDCTVYGDTFNVEFNYPGVGDNFKKIQVGLCHVRAADSILIEYDFERDGYSIKQAQVFSWDADDDKCDPKWKEAAFIPAWQFAKEESPE